MWPEGSFELSSRAACERRSSSFSRRFELSASPIRAGDLRRPLVAELGESAEVLLQPFQHNGQIHR